MTIELYYLDELKDVSLKSYIKAIKYLNFAVGGSSEKALEKYAKQCGMLFTKDGKAYNKIY